MILTTLNDFDDEMRSREEKREFTYCSIGWILWPIYTE